MAVCSCIAFTENIDKKKVIKMSIIDISSIIAAISSTILLVYQLYKELKARPRLKIVGIWRDPSSGGSPPGKGQINPDGMYSFSFVVEVRNNGGVDLNECFAYAQTDIEKRSLYAWMDYEKDLASGKTDRFGVEPYKIFNIPAHASKILRTGIKAPSEKASLKVVVRCGKIKDEKIVSITTLVTPKEKLPVSVTE